MSEWRKISDHPRDGRWFLVIGGDYKRPAYAMSDDGRGTVMIYPVKEVHRQITDGELRSEEWPTHWMPLPEPPSE